MPTAIAARLKDLQAEFETGQKMLAELDAKRVTLVNTLLRIEGAIQVLKELSDPGAAPTTTTYDCRPYATGNAETCTLNAPKAGTWHVQLSGFSAFSGVTLKASY